MSRRVGGDVFVQMALYREEAFQGILIIELVCDKIVRSCRGNGSTRSWNTVWVHKSLRINV